MMTSTSGRCVTTASTVSRMRRRIAGRRRGIALNPMIESSSIGNRLVEPFGRHAVAADAGKADLSAGALP